MTTTKICRFTQTKHPACLNMAILSDIHLGHVHTPTEWIVRNLRLALPDNRFTQDLDMIVLAGDVFDRLIDLPTSNAVRYIEQWILSLLRMCAKYDIELFIVEGTIRHDRYQTYLFDHINTLNACGVTIHYSREVSVLKHGRFNATFLFVPDEWHPDPTVTFADCKAALQAAGLDQVDFAIMHGAFEYHYPPHVHLPALNAKDFQSLVREWIFIGHIHNSRVHERIINPGSFDRLTFGEPEVKGYYHVMATGNGTVGDSIRQIPNPNPMRYDTIDVTGVPANDVITLVENKRPPAGQHLRLVCDPHDPVTLIESRIKRLYSDIRIVISPRKDTPTARLEDPLRVIKPTIVVDITPDNAVRLFETRLTERHAEMHQDDRLRILARLQEVVDD